jgi:lipopolysaccharide/colanic/teichoic acid biosynthesis glycosyltransferase
MSSTTIPKSSRQEAQVLVPASVSRRLLDLGGAIFALILLAPLWGLAVLLILYDDGPPIFFRQRRVGQNGESFLILKFRTMRCQTAGRAITVSGDNRVTRAGAWLRKRKIDELPQLINVVRGEMSLIGPRPEVPEYVEPHDELRRVVMRMRPGITDLASLMFRNEEELLATVADPEAHYRSSILPVKLAWNIRYQESRSLLRDLKLLWLTAWYSFFPRKYDRESIPHIFGMGAGIRGGVGAEIENESTRHD